MVFNYFSMTYLQIDNVYNIKSVIMFMALSLVQSDQESEKGLWFGLKYSNQKFEELKIVTFQKSANFSFFFIIFAFSYKYSEFPFV